MNIGELAYRALIDRKPTLAAAPREQLDAATAGQQMERRRVMVLLMDRIEQIQRDTQTKSRTGIQVNNYTMQLLIDLLEEVKG